MPRPFFSLLLSAIILLALTVSLAAPVPRDWARFPAIAESDANQDIYVVGDVHGDYQRLLQVLLAARVIGQKPPDPQHVQWIAGRALVVFMGDLIDKGDDALDVIRCVRALRTAANQNGGQVFSLMGNHEAEFLAKPSEKKVADFAQELSAAKLAPTAVAACQSDIGAFLCGEPFALRIRSWFFSHGGNTNGRTLPVLKAGLQAGVQSAGFASPELIGPDSILEARLGERGAGGGPWFETGGANAQALLANYAAALQVKHIVQGHQPGKVVFADGQRREKGQMFQRYGLIFLVDTGMSAAIGDSTGAVLHITPEPAEQAIAICSSGSKTTIWDAKTKPPIGVAKVCE